MTYHFHFHLHKFLIRIQICLVIFYCEFCNLRERLMSDPFLTYCLYEWRFMMMKVKKIKEEEGQPFLLVQGYRFSANVTSLLMICGYEFRCYFSEGNVQILRLRRGGVSHSFKCGYQNVRMRRYYCRSRCFYLFLSLSGSLFLSAHLSSSISF